MQKITPHLWFDKEAKEAATEESKARRLREGFSHASVVEASPKGHVTPLGAHLALCAMAGFMLSIGG